MNTDLNMPLFYHATMHTMMNKLIVVFGLPGAGKSYVATIIEKSFGYVPYNGDDDLPKLMKQALYEKKIITDDMRREFITNMVASVKNLMQKKKDVVVHQAFIKEFMRKQLLDAIPTTTFILVQTDDAIREKRYMKRTYFNLGLPYLRHMSALFEPVSIPYVTIYNNKEGNSEIVHQLEHILSSLGYSK